MWFPEGQMLQSRPRTIISTAKVMISMFSSPIGFPVITALPPKTSFYSGYFCDHIIPKIGEGLPFDLAQSPRKLMLHMDNASPTVHIPRSSVSRNSEVAQSIIRHPPRISLHQRFFYLES
jgi:hypothetical protein